MLSDYLRLDLGQSRFHQPQSFSRTRPAWFRLQSTETPAQMALLGSGLGQLGGQPIGCGMLLALGRLDPGKRLAHRMLDAIDGQTGTGFGRLDPIRDAVQRECDTRKVGRCRNDRETRRALGGAMQPISELGFGGQVFGQVILKDDPVQPLTKGHTGTTGEVLGDLAGLRVDTLDAPGRARAHPNRISQ